METVRGVPRRLELLGCSLAALVVIALATAVVLDGTEVWALLSALGEELAYVALTLAFAYLLNYEAGMVVLASLLASGSLNIFLKYLLNIPRPPPELWKVPASGPGFPSGHAQTSATFWSGVSMVARRRCVAALSAVVVLSVAASRVALGVHSVPDVVGGVAIGVAVASVPAVLLRRLGAAAAVLPLALAGAALSSWNLALGHEAGTSASLLGLGLGVAASAPLMRRSSERLRDLRPPTRLTALAAVLAASLVLVLAVRGAGPELRVLAYSILGLLIAAGPALLGRTLRASGLRNIF